jgi:serine/threonine protein kinase
MEGGALLGQGTYGCVFTPPLRCIDKVPYKVKKGDVGKITEPIDMINEITAANVLADVNPIYFVLPNVNSVCHPSSFAKQSDKDIGKCTFIKESSSKDVVHFTMPYGGVAIRKMFKPTDASESPIEIYVFMKHILEAGVHLALHGYVHYDIHQENVLVDPKTRLPKLIDFGQSFSANAIDERVLNERWKVYSPDYNPEPPEITCVTAVRKGRSIQEVIDDIMKQRTVLRDAENILGLSRRAQVKQFMKFWNSSKTIKSKDWVKFFQLYWTGFDSWSIGVGIVTLIRITNMMYKDTSVAPKMNEIKEALRGLLNLDPRERYDCLEALLILDPENAIANSAAGKAWKKERDIVRAAVTSVTT